MKNILTFRNVIAKLDNIWNFTETLKERTFLAFEKCVQSMK